MSNSIKLNNNSVFRVRSKSLGTIPRPKNNNFNKALTKSFSSSKHYKKNNFKENVSQENQLSEWGLNQSNSSLNNHLDCLGLQIQQLKFELEKSLKVHENQSQKQPTIKSQQKTNNNNKEKEETVREKLSKKLEKHKKAIKRAALALLILGGVASLCFFPGVTIVVALVALFKFVGVGAVASLTSSAMGTAFAIIGDVFLCASAERVFSFLKNTWGYVKTQLALKKIFQKEKAEDSV